MASSALCWADDVCVSSPDGHLVVKVSDDEGRLYYSVDLNDGAMLTRAALGLKTSIGDLSRHLQVVGHTNETGLSRHYTMRGTKAAGATYNYNTLTMNMQNKDGVKDVQVKMRADSFEALLAAVYLTRGLDEARRIVYEVERLEEGPPVQGMGVIDEVQRYQKSSWNH